MYNFYQSLLWKTINTQVYKKPSCTVSLFGTDYQCIVWQKNILGINLNWVQILGIQNLQEYSLQQRKNELRDIITTYKPIFIQLGSIDVLSISSRNQLQDPQITSTIKQTRSTKTQALEKQGFVCAKKENLPPSTYLIDIQQPQDVLFATMGSQHLQKIKKAKKNNICVEKADKTDHQKFFGILQQTGNKKGFGIISQGLYDNLLQWLEDNNSGGLYIAKQGGEICAGAIYLIDRQTQTAIYLYGGTNRSFANIGASQLLHWETWQILQKENIHTVDLLGGGPTGYDKHHLHNVGIFKEGFGGKKIDFVGSFDIVCKPILYKVWTWVKRLSK